MKVYFSTPMQYGLSLLAGALLTLSFPPFNQHWLGILCPLLLFSCWRRSKPRLALLQGWLFGIGLFSTGISWVFISIHTYGGTNSIIAAFITAGFVLILALFPAINGYCLQKFYRNSPLTLLLAYPASCVLIEWIRSWIF